MQPSGRHICDRIPRAAPIRFQHESTLDAPLERLWSFYMSPGALRQLSPPLSFFRVLDPGSGVADGSVLVATVGPWPLRQRWVALHAGVQEGRSFVDIALESPFAYWVHFHGFEPVVDGRSRLVDVVWFLPPRNVPLWVGRLLAAGPLRWFFCLRHRASARAVAAAEAGGRGLEASPAGHAPAGGRS